MSGDQLTEMSPAGNIISDFVSDYEAIAQKAVQLHDTGEQTQELHKFLAAIVADDIEVQQGISIEALRTMALTLGDSLQPLGDYFLTLAEATWAYAEECRIAGTRTAYMPARRDHLQYSLDALIMERESAEALQQTAEGLSDDEVMPEGLLTLYSVLDEEGVIQPEPITTILTGMKRDKALRVLEEHLSSIRAFIEAVNERNDIMLVNLDAAMEDCDAAGVAYARALDGILGTLAETDAEKLVEAGGNVADFAGSVGAIADVATAIPYPPLEAAAAGIGMLANVVEAGVSVVRTAGVTFAPRDAVRTAEGQVGGEVAGLIPIGLGFVPGVDAYRKLALHIQLAQPMVVPDDDRLPEPAVDIGVSPSLTNIWVADADESNPDYAYVPGRAPWEE